MSAIHYMKLSVKSLKQFKINSLFVVLVIVVVVVVVVVVVCFSSKSGIIVIVKLQKFFST